MSDWLLESEAAKGMETLNDRKKWRLFLLFYVGLLIIGHFFRVMENLPPFTETWWQGALYILKPTVPLWVWSDGPAPIPEQFYR